MLIPYQTSYICLICVEIWLNFTNLSWLWTVRPPRPKVSNNLPAQTDRLPSIMKRINIFWKLQTYKLHDFIGDFSQIQKSKVTLLYIVTRGQSCESCGVWVWCVDHCGAVTTVHHYLLLCGVRVIFRETGGGRPDQPHLGWINRALWL